MQSPKNFRSDIQALRGFAVLLVLLYHAGIGGLSAGYLGVDVFFVISGYLITSHLRDSLDKGNFSFTDFYIRRAKRLLPAAYVTFLVTALLAPFFLASSEMDDFRSQMAGAVTFVANIVLLDQSGYFGGDAALKPLLHVWSLSIEEQYYFILPALMFFIPRRLWKRAALLVFVASLALCLCMVQRKAEATFYLLPMRGWELAVGSLGALLLPDERLQRLWKVVFWPAVAVLLTLPFVKIAGFHPGPDALLICFATLAIILRNHPILSCGGAMRGLERLGDLSYSLYLVHWPLFAFLNNVWVGPRDVDPPLPLRLGLVTLSLLLAWALNRYVEEPARKANIAFNRTVLARTAAASVALLMLPVGITQAVATDRDYAHIRRSNFGLGPECEFEGEFKDIAACRTSEKPEILVWGDSYAMHLVPGMVAAGEQKIVQATRSVCGPLLGVAPVSGRYDEGWGKSCIAFNDSVARYLAQTDSISTVVLASPFMQFLERDYKEDNWRLLKRTDGGFMRADVGVREAAEGMQRTIEAVRALGKRVVVIAPPPSDGSDLGRCLERLDKDLPLLGTADECKIPVSSWQQSQKTVQAFLTALADVEGVEVLHPGDYLCDSKFCRTFVDGTFLYRDEGHLSYDGSVLLGSRTAFIRDILQTGK